MGASDQYECVLHLARTAAEISAVLDGSGQVSRASMGQWEAIRWAALSTWLPADATTPSTMARNLKEAVMAEAMYVRIAADLRAKIKAGKLKPGTRLPPELGPSG